MEISKPVLNMIAELLKRAAPELVPQLEQVSDIVISFKAQNDRIEAKLDLIISHLGLTEQSHVGSNGKCSEPTDRNEPTGNG